MSWLSRYRFGSGSVQLACPRYEPPFATQLVLGNESQATRHSLVRKVGGCCAPSYPDAAAMTSARLTADSSNASIFCDALQRMCRAHSLTRPHGIPLRSQNIESIGPSQASTTVCIFVSMGIHVSLYPPFGPEREATSCARPRVCISWRTVSGLIPVAVAIILALARCSWTETRNLRIRIAWSTRRVATSFIKPLAFRSLHLCGLINPILDTAHSRVVRPDSIARGPS